MTTTTWATTALGLTGEDRGAKAREIRQAIEDLVQRKRCTLSDLENAGLTRERIARDRAHAAKFARQADDAQASLDDGPGKLAAIDEELRARRTELAALSKAEAVGKVERAAKELAGIDSALLAAVCAARPDLVPQLALLAAGAGAATPAREGVACG